MIIDLVDSIQYTTTNCFAHQLHKRLNEVPNVVTVSLADIEQYPRPERIVCRLKQRTVFREIETLSRWAKDAPVVIFDQDPWCSYTDGSPFKGTYELAMQKFNVRSFAVTTEQWSKFLLQRGLPSIFVRMGVLPKYCARGSNWEDRSVNVGFIGSVHPYRVKLFNDLDAMNINVIVQHGNTLAYHDYLRNLSNLRIFIHSEDGPIIVDGSTMNLADGLWIKDVEAASQGCFSIRNRGLGYPSYMAEFPLHEGKSVVRLYDKHEDVPGIIAEIAEMHPTVRQSLIDRTVDHVRSIDAWRLTAQKLVEKTLD